MTKSRPFINVDELMPQVSIEQAAEFYGVDLGAIHRTGDEIRTRCFLNCSKQHETGDRAVAIKAQEPNKPFYCHQYGCAMKGNLVTLCAGMKGPLPEDGRVRGELFRSVAADLQAMVTGEPPADRPARPAAIQPSPKAKPQPAEAAGNRPLKESDKESVRALVDLDAKFLVDLEQMHPSAAIYVRRRSYLTPEVMRSWRCGYLPRDGGGSKTGGTLRGCFVYPVLDEQGEVLAWFGRNLDYEKEKAAWIKANREGTEPAKFRFPKTFKRGQELLGADRLAAPADQETLARASHVGILLVEGANDVIRGRQAGFQTVGLLSNKITDSQAEKLARLTADYGNGNVTVMLDCDDEGHAGSRQTIVELAKRCRVRLAWSPEMHDGAFRGKQPEDLGDEEWAALGHFLLSSR